MSIPKTQKEYLELSHFERSKLSSEVLLNLLHEDLSADDEEVELYYPLSEAFENMSEAERAKMSNEDKSNILNETPLKRKK